MDSPKSLSVVEGVLWLVQANGKEKQGLAIGQALQDLGVPYRGIYVKPFTDTLELEEPVPPNVIPVFWGSTTLMGQILNSEWKNLPTFFYRPDGFHYPTWQRHFGRKLLNGSAKILPLREVAETWKTPSPKFLRPLGDFKDFTGQVFYREDFFRWYEDIAVNGGYPTLTPDTPIVFGRPKNILQEWRFFIVKRKIISASLYREDGKTKQEAGASKGALQFVESLLDRWLPHETVVMDVAAVKTPVHTNMRIVEFNTLNTSGFYAHDVEAIVRAVTEVALEAANTVYGVSSEVHHDQEGHKED